MCKDTNKCIGLALLPSKLSHNNNTSYWNSWWDSIQAKGSWALYTASIGTTFNNTIPLKSRAALNQVQIDEQWNLVGSVKRDLVFPLRGTHPGSPCWSVHIITEYKGRKDQTVDLPRKASGMCQERLSWFTTVLEDEDGRWIGKIIQLLKEWHIWRERTT